MKIKSHIALTLILAALPSQACEFCKVQIKADFISPWTTEARPWLIYGSGATLALALLKYDVGDKLKDSWSTRKPLGSTSHAGDVAGQVMPNALYALGMGIYFWSTNNEEAKSNSVAMVKATAYSGVVTQTLKLLTHEPRPDNNAEHSAYESFPSGHTTSAFAFSSTVIARHGFWPYGCAATALATFVGMSRINDNKHYLHDVVGGFTVGTAYGLGISYLEQSRMHEQKSAVDKSSRLNILPAYSDDLKGFVASYEF